MQKLLAELKLLLLKNLISKPPMGLMNTHDKFKINNLFTVLLIMFIFPFASAQEDLFSIIREESEVTKTELLPRKMVFTQRLLWGENGLMRKTEWSPLTIEQREKELKIRRDAIVKSPRRHYAFKFAVGSRTANEF